MCMNNVKLYLSNGFGDFDTLYLFEIMQETKNIVFGIAKEGA